MSASASPKTCGWRRISLRGDAVGDVRPVALAALGAEQRQERRLEEQVAELVDQLRRRARLARGLGDLVRLLEGVRHDRLDRLHAVPRALAAQRRGQLEQLDRRLRRRPAARATRARRNRLGAVRARERERARSSAATVVGRARRARCRARRATAPSAAAPSSSRTEPACPQRLERRDGEQIGIAGAERDDEHGPYRASAS